jgi:hypothetical protein
MEDFVDIIGYEGIYLINRNGDVWSCRMNRLIKSFISYEYLRINLNKKQYLIHRLLALQFLPNPDNLPEIDHINRIKDDNRIENLRWADDYTQSVNRIHTHSKYKKYIHLEDLKNKKNPNPSWKITIRNHLCKYTKRFQFCNYTYEEVVKIRDEILTLHNIPILD